MAGTKPYITELGHHCSLQTYLDLTVYNLGQVIWSMCTKGQLIPLSSRNCYLNFSNFTATYTPSLKRLFCRKDSYYIPAGHTQGLLSKAKVSSWMIYS